MLRKAGFPSPAEYPNPAQASHSVHQPEKGRIIHRVLGGRMYVSLCASNIDE